MSHETNTFSPVVTDLERFAGGRDAPISGDVARDVYRGTKSCVGGYLKVAEEAGAEISIPIVAGAPPSGPVEDDAYEYICVRIVEAARLGCDAMFIDLHGAMVTRSVEDGEGELLRRIRAVAPDVPIAVSLDMHANLYPDIVELATLVYGYHTYPHIDMDVTAEHAGRLLLRALRGEVNPTMAWGNAPMLPHVMRQGTDDFPNDQLQARAKEMESEGALAVSVFTGFPHADITNAGLSVVVVTDDDEALAERYRDELLDFAWGERETFVYEVEPLEDSVARAKTLGTRVGRCCCWITTTTPPPVGQWIPPRCWPRYCVRVSKTLRCSVSSTRWLSRRWLLPGSAMRSAFLLAASWRCPRWRGRASRSNCPVG